VAVASRTELFDFATAKVDGSPFPHFSVRDFLSVKVADQLLDWFESEAPWTEFDVTGFGSYKELNLRVAPLPASLDVLRDDESMARIVAAMEAIFGRKIRPYVDIMAHQLLPEDAVGVHTDNDGMLSHRLILHVHRGWTPDHGGELALHAKAGKTFPIARTFPPQHRSALAFEISELSFHSIRRVGIGQRYTLVYGFFRA
jgi:2OG-Fe(II) oxygenase superfamily